MRTLLSMLAAALLVALTAPHANATDYTVCAPQDAVCVVQNDGVPGDPNCDDGYLSKYGPHSAQNAVVVNAGGASAAVRAHESCGHWYISDSYAYGVHATAAANGGTTRAYWQESWVRANPSCSWGQDHFTDRTQLGADTTATGSRVGVMWGDVTHTDCPTGASSYTCSTWVYGGGLVADTDLGCPAGAPVSPPAPGQVPYGGLLP